MLLFVTLYSQKCFQGSKNKYNYIFWRNWKVIQELSFKMLEECFFFFWMNNWFTFYRNWWEYIFTSLLWKMSWCLAKPNMHMSNDPTVPLIGTSTEIPCRCKLRDMYKNFQDSIINNILTLETIWYLSIKK